MPPQRTTIRAGFSPGEGDCPVTESNPGGTNNYIPGAPEGEDLGDGFVITGVVRSAEGCAPLEGVRIQVWLATETGSKSDVDLNLQPSS